MTWLQIDRLLCDVDCACSDVSGALNLASNGREVVVCERLRALGCGNDLQVLKQQWGILFR